MRILFLILSHERDDYRYRENTIRNTWGSSNDSTLQFYYYYGNSTLSKIENDRIYCSIKEGYENIGFKTISAVEQILEQDFNFLVRCSLSSFIYTDRLRNILLKMEEKKVYLGHVCNYYEFFDILTFPFVTGSGYVISKDVADYIVHNKHKWDNSIPDDVSISKLLRESFIYPRNWTNLEINDHKNNMFLMNDEEINLNDYPEVFHFRCRSKTPEIERNIMYNLNNFLKK
jgi:hypothetical protein